jgi:hypothetical protein
LEIFRPLNQRTSRSPLVEDSGRENRQGPKARGAVTVQLDDASARTFLRFLAVYGLHLIPHVNVTGLWIHRVLARLQTYSFAGFRGWVLAIPVTFDSNLPSSFRRHRLILLMRYL